LDVERSAFAFCPPWLAVAAKAAVLCSLTADL